MSIATDELAELVAFAARGAVPRQRQEAIIDTIRHGSVTAELDSLASRSLHSLLNASRADIDDAAWRRLEAVDIYGVDTDLLDAIPRRAGQRLQIVVFNGLLHAIRYFADLVTVLARLQSLRPEARFSLREGEEAESLVFSLAGFSILSDFLRGGAVPAAVGDLLGPLSRRDVSEAFRKAVTFTILHEFAHIELGHLSLSDARSEQSHLALLEPEPLAHFQTDELAADEAAIEMIAPSKRGDYADGLIFLLGSYAFQEVFCGHVSASHPLAANRLYALAKAMSLPAPYDEIVASWIEDRIEGWRSLAGERAREGGLIERVQQTMPRAEAHRVIAAIKQSVLATSGVLDRGEI